MALEILTEITSITADRTEGLLTDNTVYGNPNPARADLNVHVTGQKMNADVTVDATLTVTGGTEDPKTDSSWTFNIPSDGWYRFLIAVIPDYNIATTYAQYAAVTDPNNGNVYRSKSAGNVGNSVVNTTYWEPITDPGSLSLNKGEANESLNIDSLIYSVVLSPNSEYNFANAIVDGAENLCSGDCSIEDLFEYIRLANLVDGAYVHSDRSQFPQAERICRRIEALTE